MHRFLPPPIVLVLTGVAMGWVAQALPAATVNVPAGQAIAFMLAGTALLIAGAAVWAFRQHRTTINPMRPERSTALVRTGIFQYSRNPVYLADALLLLAWGVHLGNLAALLLVPVFIGVIHHFQIRPEERALEDRFGEAYREYCRKVRAWL